MSFSSENYGSGIVCVAFSMAHSAPPTVRRMYVGAIRCAGHCAIVSIELSDGAKKQEILQKHCQDIFHIFTWEGAE